MPLKFGVIIKHFQSKLIVYRGHPSLKFGLLRTARNRTELLSEVITYQ